MTAKRPAPQTIRLTEAEIAVLTEEAAKHGCLARTGPTAGQPSWRTLVKDIGNRKVLVNKT